jgi:hypothetical protein
MLYSHNLENEKINLFSLFLNKALQGEESYAPIVNEVISETHQYVSGEKNLYSIKRDSMNIILLLADSGNEYFKNISGNPESYTNEIYLNVLKILDKQKTHFAY